MSHLIKIAAWSNSPRAAVIFVHGLGGHPYDTWRRPSEHDSFWPSWLAKDIPGLAVWTLAYESPTSNWLGTAMPLQDRAKNVLERLIGERELHGRQLVFVCHSLGGLLIKQVLRAADGRRAYGDEEARLFVESVRGIVFIATPHSGSVHATMLDKLRIIAWPSASTLDLVKNNASLRDLNVWYRNWSELIRHKVFFEKQGTSAGIIVADDSSDPGLLHVDPVGIDADHLTICKPADARDLVYVRIRDFITDTIGHEAGRDYGTLQAFELPRLPRQRSIRVVPIFLRLAALLVLGLILFTGVRYTLFPPDLLSKATVEQIENTLRDRKLTTTQIDQFLESLRRLRGDPSFARAVEEARKGNTRVAEGIWRQIYEDREKARGAAQEEQAEAARNLAASAVTNNVMEGLSWFRKALALDPDDIVALTGLGFASLDGATVQESGDVFRRCIELARRLGHQPALATGLIGLGHVQNAQGDVAGALKSYRDGLAIREQLAKFDPGNPSLQRDLSASYGTVGDVQLAQDDVAGALKSYLDGLAIAQRLEDRGNAISQRDLSVWHNKIGDVYKAQGDVAEALQFYRGGLAIAERLVKSEPGNAGWQADLSVSHDRVGDVLKDGDAVGALKSYRDGLAIRERLAKSDPGNISLRHALWVSYGKIGDVQVAQGDVAGALESFRNGFAIAERLAKSDPGNADWQRNLSASYSQIAWALMKSGEKSAALDALRQGRSITVGLTTLSPDHARWRHDLEWFDHHIKELSQ